MKTTTENTKNNTKASANKHNVSRETSTKNNMKVEGKTMKKTVDTKDIYAILRGEKTITAPATKKATKEAIKAGKTALAKMQGKTAVDVDIKAVEGATDFDKLATLITTYYSDIATATKKAVRFKFIEGKIVCWRRVNNIRVYTDNTDLLPLEWVEDTHEIGYTHSTYTNYLTLAKLITANATPVEKA